VTFSLPGSSRGPARRDPGRGSLDLISVFTAPPLFTVLHGRRELGSVDESTFLAKREDGPPVLILAGRAWRVGHLDWKRRRAHVEPAEDVGRSRGRGEGQSLARELCGAIRRTLAGDEVSPRWSARAVRRMEAVRAGFPWLTLDDANVLASVVEQHVRGLAEVVPDEILTPVSEQALDGRKFSEGLPPELATRVVQARLADARGVVEVLEKPLRIVYQC
jgi:ATP-dependent Lhr-like helicase